MEQLFRRLSSCNTYLMRPKPCVYKKSIYFELAYNNCTSLGHITWWIGDKYETRNAGWLFCISGFSASKET